MKVNVSKVISENQNHVFYINKVQLWVISFKNGELFVASIPGMDITDFADLLVGCFDEESNFQGIVQKIYNKQEKIRKITFMYNGIDLYAKKGDTSKDICNRYYI